MSAVFIDAFQDLRTILCICPCCGELVRVSELHLSIHGKAPKTWLDDYEVELARLAGKEADFEAAADEIREKAVERGRSRVIERACSCLDSSIARFKYNPYDIKAIFNPVDFVVFDRLNAGGELADIAFLSKGKRGDPLLKSVDKTVKNRNYGWKVARVTDEGGVEFE